MNLSRAYGWSVMHSKPENYARYEQKNANKKRTRQHLNNDEISFEKHK